MADKERELRTRASICAEDAQAIEDKAKDENRDITDEELKRITELFEKHDSYMKQAEEEATKNKRRIEASEKLKKIAENREVGVNEVIAETIEVTEETDDFRSIGEYLQAVARCALPRGQYVGGAECGTYDRRLLKKEYRATGMGEDQPATGGFLLRKDWANVLMSKAWETMIIASKCRQFTISTTANGIKIPYIAESDRTDGNRWGGIRAYWTNEAGTLTGNNPKIGQMNMDLEKLTALCYMTDELLADAQTLNDFVLATFPEEIAFKVDDAIINGDGSGKPLGIINATSVRVQVAKETSQTATTIVAENLIKMYARLWPRSTNRAVWFANIDTFPQLAQLAIAVGTGGVPIWLPGNSIAGTPYNTLFGLPLIFVEACQTLGTEGDIILADMSQYGLIKKGGVKFASSIHVQFTTEETAFRWSYRINGQPLWHSSVTPFKGSNTQSPFITLATRS